jgi:hypothetical protein
MFLLVIVVSAVGGLMLDAAVGKGSVAEMLVSVSTHVTLMQVSILANMANSVAIVGLATLLYAVLKRQNQTLALAALGWWLGEALLCAISTLGAFGLIPLSLDFVQAGAPANSFHLALGEFLYFGLAKFAYSLHMWFYCAGGLVWYSLFYQSRYIPRAISLFGVIVVLVGFVGVGLVFFGYTVPIWVYIPMLPFELTIGFWLLLRGIAEPQVQGRRAAAVAV